MAELGTYPVIDIEGPAGHLAFGDALFRRKKKHGYQAVESPSPLLERPIADSHAHLSMLADPSLVLARCAVQRVAFVCTVTDPSEDAQVTYDNLDSWRAGALGRLPQVFEATRTALARLREEGQDLVCDQALAQRCGCDAVVPHVRIACGVHPHNAKLYTPEVEALLYDLLADPRTSMLGEVGLDYHYDLSPRDVQRQVFRRQVRIAHETGLPLMLHIRDAHQDAFEILEDEGWPAAGTLLHCCSVGPDELQRWLDRGAYVAFGGAITFKSSDQIRASAVMVPNDRLLLETDSPYMAPVPFRGQECGPEFTAYTAAYLADLRGCEAGDQRAQLLKDVWDATMAFCDREPNQWQLTQGRQQ